MTGKKDILIVAHFSGAGRKSNNRFREIASVLTARGASVELVTSSFLHQAKKHRDLKDELDLPYQVTYVDEPGYDSNVSVQRILSHRKMGGNVMSYLEDRAIPDAVYCAIPSLAVAEAVATFAQRNKIPLIWDVQDLWPEAFEMALKPKKLAKFALGPLRSRADRLYRAANAVVTVSGTYSSRIAEARGSTENVFTVYLGTNLKDFDHYAAIPLEGDLETIHLAYIGTLGHSYDLPLVFEALRILKRAGKKFKLHIMGDGPLRKVWEQDTQDLESSVVFYGRLAYPEMVSKLRACDIALNPIVPGSAGSIINKVCDYAAASLPVVNTQDSEEYRELLRDFNAGINCNARASDLVRSITRLAEDPDLRRDMSAGSRRLAEENFDRSMTYQGLADIVLDYA